MSKVLSHVPLVAGLAYRERLRALPQAFEGTLKAEPENPYNPCAVAVYADHAKVGYVAPEVARHCYDQVLQKGELRCRVRRQPHLSPSTGVEALLDLSGILSEHR